MNQQTQKKHAERLILNLFKKLYEDFPKSRIIASECPDFLLKCSPHRTIGVELTRFLVDEFNEFDPSTRKHFDPVEFRKTVHSKEEKFSSYDNVNIQSLWLLVACGSLEDETNLFTHNDIEQFRFTDSPFDKVFLLYLPEKKLFQMK